MSRSVGSILGQLDGARVPVLGIRLHKPDRGSAAWYAGLGVMTAFEVIEWPVALVIGVSHALSTHAPSRPVRKAAEGVQAGS